MAERIKVADWRPQASASGGFDRCRQISARSTVAVRSARVPFDGQMQHLALASDEALQGARSSPWFGQSLANASVVDVLRYCLPDKTVRTARTNLAPAASLINSSVRLPAERDRRAPTFNPFSRPNRALIPSRTMPWSTIKNLAGGCGDLMLS